MTEKEKMLHGMLYDGNDAQLVQDRNTAKDLCYEFNHLRPSDVKGQEKLLKNLLGEIHGDFSVMAPFYCDYGYNIEIGEHFFANHNTVILDCAKVTFGKYVFIALVGDELLKLNRSSSPEALAGAFKRVIE